MNAPATPQQARAVATRDAIVDAAVDCLAAAGISGATTGAVAKRAGVSQGALFRYFPTRNALHAAAVERLLDALYLDAADGFVEAFDSDDPIGDGVIVLWDVFTDPRLYGAFELFLAARTDEDLAAALAPVLDAHADRELALARMLFPDAAATHPHFDQVVLGLLATLQGVAVGAASRPHAGSFELRFIQDIVRRELGAPTTPPVEP